MGIRVKKTRVFWHPELAIKAATEIGMSRMTVAAEVLKSKIKSNLQSIIQRQINRPEYKRKRVKGKWVDVEGPWWTARVAGQLLETVRSYPAIDGKNNIWVMVGSKKAYYAAMFEYATRSGRGEPFWRPAISSSRAKMKAIVERGE